MAFYIRYTTATHKGLDGPFRSLPAARRRAHRRGEREWYIMRLGVIVEAEDSYGAIRAEAIEAVEPARRQAGG